MNSTRFTFIFKLPEHWPKLTVLGIFLILVICASNINWGKNHWKTILEADAKGYYAYLPATFIYNDLNFGFFDKIEKEKYFDKNTYYDYRTASKGIVINKYYCGTSILQLPFFLMAHGLTQLSNGDADGYSRLYPIFINLAAIVYTCIGLLFLAALLKLYHIKPIHRCLTLICCTFGTNLFYYTVSEAGMSHVYSFTCMTLFFYLAKIYFIKPSSRYLFYLALLSSLIVLIRPVNGLIIFALPLAAQSQQQFLAGWHFLFKNKFHLVTVTLGGLLFISVQLIIYKISTGHFFIYAYGGEHLYLFSPNVFNILFSYKKGLFLYTPLYLISLSGLYFFWKQNRFEAWSLSIFLYVVTYILSCWWMWFYGGSFSSRVFVEYLCFFMIPLAFTFQHLKPGCWQKSFFGLTLLIVLMCQVQTFQYRYNQIHWSDMTKEKYWDVFLRIDKLL